MRRILVPFLALALGAAALGTVEALRPVAQVQAEARWELAFTPGTFSSIVAGTGRTSKARYYLPYTLSNKSGDERTPYLRIHLSTETDKSYGDRYDAYAYKALAEEWKKEVTRTSKINGQALADGAQAEAVACFGAIDPQADSLTVRVYGLWDPVVRDDKGRLWNENRVLVLKYSRPGDEYRRWEDKITLVSTTEEVEGEVTEITRARDASAE